MKGLKESVIENQILTWLYYQKIWAWKNPSAGYFDQKVGKFRRHVSKFAINGVSDIIGIYKGRPLFIECKSSSGVLSASQKEFLERARREGALAFIARNISDVERELGLISDTQKPSEPTP